MRLEQNPDGIFENRATQTVFYRDFEPTKFEVKRQGEAVELNTSRLRLTFDGGEFDEKTLCVYVKGNIRGSVWRFGQKAEDLGGTARTLDEADGEIPLGSGIVSRKGFSLLDDSTSLVLREDGFVEPRRKGVCDLYFFGYGHDYRQALHDFYRLCGSTPMLPRYALGNWWNSMLRIRVT